MARKIFCVIPASWAINDLLAHSCDDRSHHHLTWRQAWALECDGLAEWVKTPTHRHDRGIVRLRRRLVGVRGLSCRVGATLAAALARFEPWAFVMLADIQVRPVRAGANGLIRSCDTISAGSSRRAQVDERLTMETLIGLLKQLAAERFSGQVNVHFDRGEIHKSESLPKSGGVPTYRPAGLETRGASASNPQ